MGLGVILVTVLLYVLPTLQYPTISTLELNSLQSLYDATNGGAWTYGRASNSSSNWNFSTADPNPCYPGWKGVTCGCDRKNCSITELQLDAYNMSGSLPDSLGSLTKLQSFSALNNNLTGTIPDNLYSLTNLSSLLLGSNQLTGQISSAVVGLSAIESFYLYDNQLHGSIPEELCALTTLRLIDWSTNSLKGTLPNCIGNLSLNAVYFYENELSGTIPEAFVRMNWTLLSLNLFHNAFTGPLPSGLLSTPGAVLNDVNLKANQLTGPLPVIRSDLLILIDLSNNALSGSLSESIIECTRLIYLYLSHNSIGGPLPLGLSDLSLLSYVYLAFNQFTGPIPEVTSNHLSLSTYALNNNLLTGTLPASLCLRNLEYFSAAENRLQGTIPSCIAAPGLSFFILDGNSFSGSIPASFENATLLETFTLSSNRLTGWVPTFANSPSLQFLYLENNRLSGPIRLSNSSSSLAYVDFSNNQITGTLPTHFFTPASVLISFSVTSNCLSGSIPTQLCSVPGLLFLDLDGLGSGSDCRSYIFPALSSVFQSYVLQHHVQGGIPDCLFRMDTLQTLHVSGNSIQWSFPNDLLLSPSLTALSLSHNEIKGSIPGVIQSRQWTSLDLSYNKLEGVLSLADQASANASLTLAVNRLSGVVPASVLNLQSVDILTGNLFACDFDRDALPVHDRAYKTFQCGSNSFNQALVVWGAIVGVTAGVAVLAWYLRNRAWHLFVRWFKCAWDYALLCLSVFSNVDGNERLYAFRCRMFDLTKLSVGLTAAVVLVFVPVYGALNAVYSTTTYQYAWTISAAFSSGVAPAVVLLVFYMLFICVLHAIGFASARVDQHSEEKVSTGIALAPLQVAALTVAVLVNCIVMVLVNGGYVAIILKYNTNVVIAAQLGTAVFKLLWNDFAVSAMIFNSRRFARGTAEDKAAAGADAVSAEDGDGEMHETELPYSTFIVLFNSIIAPILATAAVDSDCFANVFVAPAPVTTVYTQYNSPVTFDYSSREFTTSSTSTSISVSYDPPFLYSYQCSSSILTNYASVYVIMFTLVALKPVTVAAATALYHWLPRDSLLFRVVDYFLTNLAKPAKLKKLETRRAVFHKERFVLRLVSKAAVFLTFGVIFPVLAVVICVALVTEVLLTLFMIGRYVVNIRDEGLRRQFRDLLGRDCEGLIPLLRVPLIREVVPFAACLYAFFILDIYGDAVGFRRAVWAPVLMACTPALLWAGYGLWVVVGSGLRKKGSAPSVVVEEEAGTELTTMNIVHASRDEEDKP